MLLTKFKSVIVRWFGTYDYYTINYMIYVAGGVWTLKKKYVGDSQRLHNFFRGFLFVMHSWALVGMLWDGYTVRNNVEKLYYSLSSLLFYVVLLGRTIILIPKKDDLDDCFQLINHNFYIKTIENSRRYSKIFRHGEAQLKKLTLMFYILAVATVTLRGVSHVLAPERMLMIPYPFEHVMKTPFFEMVFTIQTLGLLHFVTVVISYEMTICGFLIRVTKHFEILSRSMSEVENVLRVPAKRAKSHINRLEALKRRFPIDWNNRYSPSDWKTKVTPNILRNLIIHHQQILLFMKKVNKLVEKTIFFQIFGAGLLLAILLVDVIWQSSELSSKIITECFYAGSVLADISVLCYYGSEVEQMSHHAGNALYATPWMLMDSNCQKTTSLFMMRLRKTPVLKAGGIFPVTLDTYIKFLKLIYNNMAFMENAVRRNAE